MPGIRGRGAGSTATTSTSSWTSSSVDAQVTFDAVNLAHLLCGSEGTLAVTVGATLRSRVETPATGPGHRSRSPDAGSTRRSVAVDSILATGPAAVELIDDVIIGLARDNVEYRRYVELLPLGTHGAPPGAVLYVEYFADDDGGRRAAARRAGSRGGSARRHPPAGTPTLKRWRRRGSCARRASPCCTRFPATASRRPSSRTPRWSPEAPARVRQAEFRRDRRPGTARRPPASPTSPWAACTFARMLSPARSRRTWSAMEAIARKRSPTSSRSYGGALSGEHGDGRARSHLLQTVLRESHLRRVRRASRRCSIRGHLLNPGNIVDAPADDRRRCGCAPTTSSVARPAPLTTNLPLRRPSRASGSAVDLCNGAGSVPQDDRRRDVPVLPRAARRAALRPAAAATPCAWPSAGS